MGINRRDFLKTTAAGTAGATMATGTVSLLNAKKSGPGGELGKWVPTACQGCTSWCSVEGYVIDGRVTKVRGNPHCMGNQGKICPRPHLAIQQVYDADRIATPLKRTNPRKGLNEDPKFVPISWDEALGMLADKMIELRKNNESHKSVVFRGRYTFMHGLLYSALPQIFGTPNNISHSSICAEGEKFGPYYTEAFWGYNDFDLENTRYMLSFGVDPLSMNRMVPTAIKAWGPMRDNAKVTVIDPRYSSTSAKADRWMPVIPGEDSAIAVAIAHVILTEGRWYKGFAGDFKDGKNRFVRGQTVDENTFDEKHTNGLVKWWNLELKDRTPQWAAEKAGVSAADIINTAREFAAAAPHAIAWSSASVGQAVRGSYTGMSVHALNGLVGSIDNEGGVLQGMSTGHAGMPSTASYQDDQAKTNSKQEKIDHRGRLDFPNLAAGRAGSGVNTNRVADGINNEDPYDIKLAIGYWCNFNFSCTGTDRWNKALAKLPFFAHITPHPTEMTHFADIVLPTTAHMFERQSGFLGSKQNLHTYVALHSRLVQPYGESKDDETEITWMLAQKLAERGFDNLKRYYENEFADPETGRKPTNEVEFAQYAVKVYTKPIWDGSSNHRGDTMNSWADFKRVGVWNANRHPYRQRWDNFGTVTKKFEFYSETLKKVLGEHAAKHNVSIDRVMEVCNQTARGDVAFVPHYEPAYRHGDPRQYPLIFGEHKSRLNREGRSQNASWYYVMKDVDPGDEAHKDVAKINPETARQYGIKDGDKIRITSIAASIECEAKLWEGIRPDMVVKAYGQGHWAYGRHASKGYGVVRGGNNNDIHVVDYDRLTGSTVRNGGATRVRIEKV